MPGVEELMGSMWAYVTADVSAQLSTQGCNVAHSCCIFLL